MNRAYFLVNGIDTWPGAAKNWNSRGVTWLMSGSEFPVAAEKIEYLCGPIDRAFGQKERCAKFMETADAYGPQDWRRIAIGHSNGCAVILSALKQWPSRFEELHLVAAACDPDFRTNGLNKLLFMGTVGRVFIYCCGKDEPLRWAASWFGKLLGYGDLGRKGPVNMLPEVADRVRVIRESPWDSYGHGDCFHPDNFARTMKEFVS